MSAASAVAVAALVGIIVALLSVMVLRHRGAARIDQLERQRRRRGATVAVAPEPSRTIRLLDGHERPAERGSPPRPRLPLDRPYVFGEVSSHEPLHAAPPRGRHDDRWALERSSRRARVAPGSLGVIVAVVAILVALIVAGTVLQHDSGGTTTTVTSTTVR